MIGARAAESPETMSKPILPVPGHYPAQQMQAGVMLGQQGPAGLPPNPPNPPAPTKPTYSKRGKITIVACVPCRKRKTKCDGKRPECTQCQSREGQCHYDMSEEQRRLTFLREHGEQLAEQKAALEALLWNLGNSTEVESAEILRRLRNGTDPYELTTHISASQSLAQVRRDSISGAANTPYPPLFSTSAHSGGSRIEQYEGFIATVAGSTPLELDEIVRRLRNGEDISRILVAKSNGQLLGGLEGDFHAQVQALGLTRGDARGLTQERMPHAHTPLSEEFPWVTVTNDVAFIDHLITAYFYWQHPFFQSFSENRFREDMAEGRMKYCSRFLVNAICAAGCLLTTHPKAQKDPTNSNSGYMIFYNEAVRLLHDESSSSLATVAGLFLLCNVDGHRGRMSQTWAFSGQSGRMALDLNLHLRSEKRTGEQLPSDVLTEEQAKTQTFWGSFVCDQITSFTMGRLPQIPVQAITIDLPHITQLDDDEPWIPYGAQNMNVDPTPTVGLRATCFSEVASLSKLVNSTLTMFFAPSQAMSGTSLLSEYQKYTTWFDRLPASLGSAGSTVPHVLCLHMYYHCALLMLFRPFLKAKITESEISPADICRDSANRISELFAMHLELYGTTGIFTFQIHSLLTACTIHLVNIPAPTSTTYLTSACNQLQDLVPRIEWAAACLTIIKELVAKWGLTLPAEVEAALYRNHDAILRPSFLDDNTDPSLAGAPMPAYAEMFRPYKRAANGLSSPEQTQKRQRTEAGGVPTANMGQSSVPIRANSNSSPPSARKVNNTSPSSAPLLFAPFPNQPAPLLAPPESESSVKLEGLTFEASGMPAAFTRGESAAWLFDPFLGDLQGDE